ncbi:MAG: Bro-N domain-containing protein [Candidatus Falkowbacteria bacterium]
METDKLAIFHGQKVRRVIYNNEWWFVVEDIVLVLTESVNPKDYINKMLQRDEELNKGYGQIVRTLEVKTAGGKQKMNCANTEGIFRIIQSIPSPKAEPFKRWLAKVGYEQPRHPRVGGDPGILNIFLCLKKDLIMCIF